MYKKGGFFANFVLIILFVGLAVASWYLYQVWPREPVTFDRINIDGADPIVLNDVASKQFYPRMRYADRTITYSIASSCSSDRVSSMEEAFANIESVSILNFVESTNAQIKILCSDVAPEAGQENYFVAGEGGPSKVLNSTYYSVILEGKIALYRDDTCSGAKVATHELLHALGFDHNNNKNSILYPTLRCDQTIDADIIDSINELYATDSLADLTVYAVNATKAGRYLNFHIEILNQGLVSSEQLTLGIYSGDKLIDTFDVGAVSVGARKILDVENLKVPSDANSIVFFVDHNGKVNELDEFNNKATLKLALQ
ncbi:MAG: matrixin family metalloprotease [Candidatus Pacearchaeota archaeon]